MFDRTVLPASLLLSIALASFGAAAQAELGAPAVPRASAPQSVPLGPTARPTLAAPAEASLQREAAPVSALELSPALDDVFIVAPLDLEARDTPHDIAAVTRLPIAAVPGRIDLNRADTHALQTLPGIGATKAAAIVAYREGAPFRTVRQLAAVQGIGPRTLERVRPMVYVDASASAVSPR